MATKKRTAKKKADPKRSYDVPSLTKGESNQNYLYHAWELVNACKEVEEDPMEVKRLEVALQAITNCIEENWSELGVAFMTLTRAEDKTLLVAEEESHD